MRSLVAAIFTAGVLAGTTLAQAQGQPLSRPLTLPERTLRVDLAPSDYGYMDHGVLNEARGLRIFDAGDDVGVALGAGVAYGVVPRAEIGALALPIQLAPDGDMGDMEFYGRYALGSEVALQATLQLPTQTDVGLGFGVPVHFHFGSGNRLETGVELELIFAGDTQVHLDLPLAVQFAVTQSAFAGVRTGIFFADMEEIAVNLGATGGISVTRDVELSGSLNFPIFLNSGEGDAISLDFWQLIFGATLFFGV